MSAKSPIQFYAVQEQSCNFNSLRQQVSSFIIKRFIKRKKKKYKIGGEELSDSFEDVRWGLCGPFCVEGTLCGAGL